MKFNKWTLGLAALAVMSLAGCSSNHKVTKQSAYTGAAIVETAGGVVLYPSHYVSVTNGAGQVVTYAEYSAISASTKQPFSFAGVFFGYGTSLKGFTDVESETHTGSGNALLADAKYSQLTSEFTSGSRFSGGSQLSIGSLDLIINTNAITASGGAGSELLQGLGSAIGQVVNKGVTGKP